MFDVDEFVDQCKQALGGDQPRTAVKEVLARAVSSPDSVDKALPASRAQIVPLYATDELTVLHVVWAPGMRFRPHNHLVWAAIGLYGGEEDNTFYRRCGDGLEVAGGRALETGDVALLGEHTIHAVENPRRTHTAAIHVYGGDVTRLAGRSEWDESTGEEVDYDFVRTRRYFESFAVPSAGAA
jgi:predicted metal-dependent enzyme (double-stranded beta helix superfamily)